MGCTDQTKNSFLSKLEVTRASDNRILSGSVLFTNGGKTLVAVAGRACELYSVNTGEFIKELFRCESKIAVINFLPNSTSEIFALSESGELVQYQLDRELILKTSKLTVIPKTLIQNRVAKFNVDKIFQRKSDRHKKYKWDQDPVNDPKKRQFHHAALNLNKTNSPVLWASWSMHDEYQSHVSVFLLQNGKQLTFLSPSQPLKKCYKNFGITQTFDNNLLFVGMGQNFVIVALYGGKNSSLYECMVHVMTEGVEFNCLTLHPSEYSFATADSRGVILVWRNILDKHPIKSSYSWHTVDINDMAFTSEGTHLLSGGDENVLVKWSFMTNQKNFLPRMSSRICNITVADEHSLVALTLADNEIFILDSNLAKVSIIKRFVMQVSDPCCKILTSDPRHDRLVMSGRPGYIQFLSHKKQLKHLYSFDVGRVNYMTGDKHLVNLVITHAKFSRNGSWLVTAEKRNDAFIREYRLKFWSYDETKQSYVLNTNMELPHDENEIHALEVSSDDLVATTGADKVFKLWAPFETNDLNETKTVWSFLSVGRYRDLPCDPIDFCKDATLVAVGFGPSLTLWSTSSCSLKCSLIPPFQRDNLKFIKFGSEEFSHLIVTATDHNVTTWNIITLTIVWTVDLEVAYLVGEFFSTYMCAFSKNNTLFVFTPATTSPDRVMENVSDYPVVAAHSVTWGSSTESHPFQLYFLNSKMELFCLKCKGEADEMENGGAGTSEAYSTPFSAQLARKSKTTATKQVSKYVPTKSRVDPKYISSVLDAPSHMLPNPTRFSSDFLQSLTTVVRENAEFVKKANASNERCDEEIADETAEANGGDKEAHVTDDMLWTIVNDLFK